jgi:hypothetical protein
MSGGDKWQQWSMGSGRERMVLGLMAVDGGDTEDIRRRSLLL